MPYFGVVGPWYYGWYGYGYGHWYGYAPAYGYWGWYGGYWRGGGWYYPPSRGNVPGATAPVRLRAISSGRLPRATRTRVTGPRRGPATERRRGPSLLRHRGPATRRHRAPAMWGQRPAASHPAARSRPPTAASPRPGVGVGRPRRRRAPLRRARSVSAGQEDLDPLARIRSHALGPRPPHVGPTFPGAPLVNVAAKVDSKPPPRSHGPGYIQIHGYYDDVKTGQI